MRSALEKTMTGAYAQIHEIWKQRRMPDLRAAAFSLAIERVARASQDLGIFPWARAGDAQAPAISFTRSSVVRTALAIMRKFKSAAW